MTGADASTDLAAQFEGQRPRLRAVAYRMLGSAAEADDAVQEAWLRAERAGAEDVVSLPAWLTTVVARVCLNLLRARAARREEPLDMPTVPSRGRTDPEEEALLAESVGVAMLVVLDTLTPAERLAFVLHDLFDVPFDDVAVVVGRSEPATRKLASRARARVRGAEATPTRDLARQRRVVDAYLAATRDGDFEALLALLDPDVVLRADAASTPARIAVLLHGARSVVEGAIASGLRARISEPVLIDGTVGLAMPLRGRLAVALAFTFEGERITEIDVIADRARLAGLQIALAP